MKNIIAIDLGSNTIRFIKFSIEQNLFISEYEEIIRTSENISTDGIISAKAETRVIKAIENAKKYIDFSDSCIVPVATASFRIATNSSQVIKNIFKKTDILFEVISGQTEALLTGVAVKKQALEFGHQTPILVLDIGGASTEIVYLDNEKSLYTSLNIGIVTYTERYNTEENLIEQLQKDKESVVTFLELFKNLKKPTILASTAGTPTTLASYLHGLDYNSYDKTKVNNTKISIERIKDLKNQFKAMDKKSLEVFVGVNRGDLILTGITIFEKIIGFLNFKETYVFDNSLREGIVFNKCTQLQKQS